MTKKNITLNTIREGISYRLMAIYLCVERSILLGFSQITDVWAKTCSSALRTLFTVRLAPSTKELIDTVYNGMVSQVASLHGEL